MADVMTLTVKFDDGPEVEVGVKQRDVLRLEELDRDIKPDPEGNFPLRLSYVPMLAWLALGRMHRAGKTPDGFEMPASFDEFRDMCDVEGEAEPAGPSVPAPSTGS